MLKIIVELHPFGNSENKKILSEIEISNTLKINPHEEHEYKYVGWVKPSLNSDEEKTFSGKVYHNRINFVYILIYKIIHKIIQPYL